VPSNVLNVVSPVTAVPQVMGMAPGQLMLAGAGDRDGELGDATGLFDFGLEDRLTLRLLLGERSWLVERLCELRGVADAPADAEADRLGSLLKLGSALGVLAGEELWLRLVAAGQFTVMAKLPVVVPKPCTMM